MSSKCPTKNRRNVTHKKGENGGGAGEKTEKIKKIIIPKNNAPHWAGEKIKEGLAYVNGLNSTGQKLSECWGGGEEQGDWGETTRSIIEASGRRLAPS